MSFRLGITNLTIISFSILVIAGCSTQEVYRFVEESDYRSDPKVPEPDGACYYRTKQKMAGESGYSDITVRPLKREGDTFIVEIYGEDNSKTLIENWRFLCDQCGDMYPYNPIITYWMKGLMRGNSHTVLSPRNDFLPIKKYYSRNKKNGKSITGFRSILQKDDLKTLYINEYSIEEDASWFASRRIYKERDGKKTLIKVEHYQNECITGLRE